MGIQYGRKFTNKRKRTSSRRPPSKAAVMYKRPTARTQQVQIAKLASAVRANSRRIATQRYLVQHRTTFEEQAINNVSTYAPYRAWGLTNPQFMTQIFGDPEEAKGGKYTGKTLRLDFQLGMGKSTKVTDMTAFVVRPRTQKVVNECGIQTTNTLSPTAAQPDPMVAGTDYSYEGGIALMNPKRWHIDKMWKIQLRPNNDLAVLAPPAPPAPPPATQQYTNLVTQSNYARRSFTMKNPLYINSRTGEWSAVNAEDTPPHQRAFLVIFNNSTPLANPSAPGVGPTFEGMVHLTAHTSE